MKEKIRSASSRLLVLYLDSKGDFGKYPQQGEVRMLTLNIDIDVVNRTEYKYVFEVKVQKQKIIRHYH